MRWPIQLQLLAPMLSVVLFAIVLASATSAYLGGARARREQEESLRRMVSTLSEATFPLTQRVLAQMRGLSSAEFVLLDQEHHLQETTLPLAPAEVEELAALPVPASAPTPAKAVLVLGRQTYLVDRVAVGGRSGPVSPGALYILFPEDRWSAGIYQAMYPALVTGVIAAVLVVVTTTVLARRFVRPIHDLVGQTASVAQGRFTPVTVSRRNDELRDLAQSINQMTLKLAHYETDVRRNERLRTLDQLGAGLAHQLRNAAAGSRMAIELHQRDCPLTPGDESLAVVLRQLRLMESYLQRFLSLSKPARAIHARAEVTELIDEVLTLMRPTSIHVDVGLEFTRPMQPLFLRGDPENVRQLLTNLVGNAIDAAALGSPSPPRVIVAAEQAADGRGIITVCDTGSGPPETVASRLGEAFVTSKPDGVGLGLFVARQIAEAHQGSLDWERRNGWTCFRFAFPLDSATIEFSEDRPKHGASFDCG